MKSYLGYVYFRFGANFDPYSGRWKFNENNVVATLSDFTIMNLERSLHKWYDHNACKYIDEESTLAKTALLFKQDMYKGKGICACKWTVYK